MSDELTAEVLEPHDIEKQANAELDRVQDRLYQESAAIVSATLRFADFDFDGVGKASDLQLTDDLIAEHGGDREAAARALRVAWYASLPAKEVPAGMKMAVDVYRGILASRAAQKQTHVSMGVAVIHLEPGPSLPSKTLKKEADG